jgi:hypothetical protein
MTSGRAPIRFELPFALPSLNTILRQCRSHAGKRRGVKKARNDLAWAVVAAIGRQRPPVPLARVRVRIESHAARMLDPIDNLPGSVKNLMDVLQPPSTSHPAGLGIIQNDSAACVIVSEVVQIKLTRGTKAKTVVIIEEA